MAIGHLNPMQGIHARFYVLFIVKYRPRALRMVCLSLVPGHEVTRN